MMSNMEDKTIYQKYDELLKANTRLSAMVSMKFTAEQQEYLESNIEMDGLDITKVKGSIYGHVKGDVKGNIGHVGGNIYGDVGGDLGGNVCGDVRGSVKGDVCGDVCGDIGGDVGGNVQGNVYGTVEGTVYGNVGKLSGRVLSDTPVKVIKVEEDTINQDISYEGKMVTLKNSMGQTFIVNIPDVAWGEDAFKNAVFGLNLVYGKGIHYT